MLVRMQNTETLKHCWWECKMVLENILAVSYKVFILKEQKFTSHKNLYTNVYGSSTHNHQKPETTQVPLSE